MGAPILALAQKPPTCALAAVGGITRCSVYPGMPVNTTLSWQLTYLQHHTYFCHGCNRSFIFIIHTQQTTQQHTMQGGSGVWGEGWVGGEHDTVMAVGISAVT